MSVRTNLAMILSNSVHWMLHIIIAIIVMPLANSANNNGADNIAGLLEG